MYKLIAFDLDETLFNDNGEIDYLNLQAMHAAQRHGVKLVPASGRTPGFLGDVLESLGVNEQNDEYCILGNGGVIVENYRNTILYAHPLSFDLAITLFNFGLDYDVCIQVFTPEQIYFFNTDPIEHEYALRYPDIISFKKSSEGIAFLKDKTIIKMIYEKRDMEYLEGISKALNKLNHNEFAVSFSSGRYLELNQLGINKGHGLKELADYLKIDLKDTIAIGDNHNDLEMIEMAGLGVGVNNAIDEVKRVADYICESDHNDNALAEVINKFILGAKHE